MQDGNLLLVTLRAITNGALKHAGAAGALPERLKVLSWGESSSVKGPVKLNEASVASLPQRQREMGFDKVALDFEHNTVPGSLEYERTKEPRAVAAYGVPRIVAGEGLFLEQIEWTPEGQKAALNYADLSPAVQFDAQGNVCFVHSVALTRNGAVEGLSFFNVESHMSNQTNTPGSGTLITLVALAGALGLSATATEADVMGRITFLNGFDDRLKKLEEAGKITTLSATDLAPLTARLDKIEQELKAGSAAAQDKERDNIICLFTTEGKVPNGPDGKPLSAEQLKALDVPTLKILHANTPVTVPLSARSGRVEGAKDSGLKGLAKTAAAFQRQVDSAKQQN